MAAFPPVPLPRQLNGHLGPLEERAVEISSDSDVDANTNVPFLDRCLKLTVDTGDRNVILARRGFPFNVRNVFFLRVELLRGWHWWDDFTSPGAQFGVLASLAECRMSFFGDLHGQTGLGTHRYVFVHPLLRSLTIENHPDMVEDYEPLHFPSREHTTNLRTLTVSGVDVMTLGPALALPHALGRLELRFTARVSNALAKTYMQFATADVLDVAFAPLLKTLRHLDFHHHHLSEFRWGAFEQLESLRVHQDHLFPAHRPLWDVPLRALLPTSLRELVVHGCQFVAPGEEEQVRLMGATLEQSMLRLARELLASGSAHRLTKITLELAEGSAPAPAAVVLSFQKIPVSLKIVGQTKTLCLRSRDVGNGTSVMSEAEDIDVDFLERAWGGLD